MGRFWNRIVRAARLDVSLYEEVEADRSATGQALAVIVLQSVAAGVAAGSGLGGILVAAVGALIAWFLWALVIYLVGAKILPEPTTRSNLGELLRTTGFAGAPGLIRFLGVIPFLYWLVVLVASVWMLITMVIAVRQALDYRSTLRAVVVCVLGWLAYALLMGVIRAIAG